jgi:hypothetical protein
VITKVEHLRDRRSEHTKETSEIGTDKWTR